MRTILITAMLLGGCYASHPQAASGLDSSVRDATIEDDASTDADSCACPCMDVSEACGPAPATVVPVNEFSVRGQVAHWRRDRGCIAVEYEPELEPIADEIRAAVSAWFDLPCSSLCYVEPLSVPPGNRSCAHAIHFVPEDFYTEEWGTCGAPGTSGILMTTATAAIQHACAVVSTVPTPVSLLSAVGWALGFQQPSRTGIVDSVLSFRAEDRDRTTLGTDDVAVFCTMYGETPWCPR